MAINFFLADAEVLHIEEADVLDGMLKLFDERLLASRLVKLAQIEGYERGPIDCLTSALLIEKRSLELTVCLSHRHLLVRSEFYFARHD